MLDAFSLARRAWLPVALTSGQRELVRLCDLTRSDILRVATGRPDCDISLTEFLIGMLAAAIGPADDLEWHERFHNPPTASELEAAFTPFTEALILDGDGPRFFQDREKLDGQAGPISGLLIDAPGASTLRDNADHFVKRGHTQCLSRAAAAIVLATLQTSAPSGGAGHRTSLRGGGPLTTLAIPGINTGSEPTLWQRLWANVPSDMRAEPADNKRIFPWLVPTRVSDKSGVATAPTNVARAQAFFGMPRRIRLVFESNTHGRVCDLLGIVDEVVVTGYVTRPWGTNYEGWSRGHPLSPYYKVKPSDTAFLPAHLQSSRIGYREWRALALGTLDQTRVPADCIVEFMRRASDMIGDHRVVMSNHRLLAAGYAMDNMKPLDFGEALLPLIISSTQDVNELIRRLADKLVSSAELVARQLVSSVNLGLFGENNKVDSDSAVLQPTGDRFWADTEEAFFDNLRDAAQQFDAAKDNLQAQANGIMMQLTKSWLQAMRRHALRIFDDAVPIEAAESKRIANVVNARKFLGLALEGHGSAGNKIFGALGLPMRVQLARKPKAASKARASA